MNSKLEGDRDMRVTQTISFFMVNKYLIISLLLQIVMFGTTDTDYYTVSNI